MTYSHPFLVEVVIRAQLKKVALTTTRRAAIYAAVKALREQWDQGRISASIWITDMGTGVTWSKTIHWRRMLVWTGRKKGWTKEVVAQMREI